MNEKQMKYFWGSIIFIIAIAILVRIFIPTVFWRDGNYYPHMYSRFMFPLGMFAMVLFWGFVIYVVLKLFSDNNKKSDNELTILKRRLSRGEITIEEYEKISERLKGER
ncbi:MAG: hypothetical protein K9L64_00555 [Candidatus Izimaplasma sp.]|nr:hypothetical protein [Candidatus Izimaplasma bacterium]